MLVVVLDELHGELAGACDEGDTGLDDFGDHLLPRLVERGRTSSTPSTVTGATWASRTSTCGRIGTSLTDDLDVRSVPGWPILSRYRRRRRPGCSMARTSPTA